MKHKRKALSLLLVLAMVVCFAVPAMAASPENVTVTVYVTTGMFTSGGYDEATNTFTSQEFRQSERPAAHLFDNYKMKRISTANVDATALASYRAVYSPVGLTNDMNVLDAIIAALKANGYTCAGGWDTYNTPNGGYISSVSPNGVPTSNTPTTRTIGNVTYTVYSGTGWQIAFKEKGASTYTVPSQYGTNYTLTDGMTIIFDLSPYVIYY